MKNTIKSRKNFIFGENAISISMPAFMLLARPKMFETSQYGIIASKKLFPLAVSRNRAKRLLRAWLQACNIPENYDILLISRPSILTSVGGINQMKKALGSIECSKK